MCVCFCFFLNLAYIWEDEDGEVHTIHQSEGGEQGDALMPLLFSVGQHAALEATQRKLRRDERLFAFLDYIYLVSKPERVGEAHSVLERELWVHAKIRVHSGKTHVWNRSGRRPLACDELQQRAILQDPTARVWTGSGVPTQNQGIKVLGCPLGHEDFVTTQLEAIGRKHRSLVTPAPLCFSAGEFLLARGQTRIGGPICTKARCQFVGVSLQNLGHA